MNKLIYTLVAALVLTGGAAYGQSASQTAHNKKQVKHQLRDNQMDKVTAAGEENSAVAANGSSVTEDNTGSVNISGTALEGAKGVNVTSSSDAMVGNGVNVYNSDLAAAASNSGAKVTQANAISQDSKNTASIDKYSRGANSQFNGTWNSTETESNTSSKSVNATLNHTDNSTKSASNNLTTSSSSTDKSSDIETSATTSGNTKSSSDVGSSSSNHTFNGNDTNTSNSSANAASSSASGSTNTTASSSYGNTSSSGGASSASSGGANNTIKTNGPASASNATHNASSTDTDASTSAHTSSENDTTASNVTSTKNTSDTDASETDKSSSTTHNTASSSTSASTTAATLVASSNETHSENETKNNHVIHNVEGALSIGSVSGQNIAVDGSKVDSTNNYSVTLAGAAEQNATAMNIVNAAGGMVANGVNVARTANMNSTPTLSQVNSVSQSR